MSRVVLRRLTMADEMAFFEGLKKWEGEDLSWYTFDWREGVKFRDHLERLDKNEKGLDLPEGFVPSTMLYGFVDGEIVGRVSIRHQLNKFLEQRGGHIGYAVAPVFRGKGLASEMVSQSFETCRQLGLNALLVTCGDDNIASWKIIERIGGRKIEVVWDSQENEYMRKYQVILRP